MKATNESVRAIRSDLADLLARPALASAEGLVMTLRSALSDELLHAQAPLAVRMAALAVSAARRRGRVGRQRRRAAAPQEDRVHAVIVAWG